MFGDSTLFPNPTVSSAVHAYSESHSTPLPPHFTPHRELTIAHTTNPNMMISPLQAQFQLWLAKTLRVRRVLEVGCFTGYSALGWAEAVGKDGEVLTLDVDEETGKVAREAWEKYGVGERVKLIVGPALDSLKALPTDQPYDLVFIDADKGGYVDYLKVILERNLVAPNKGVVLADNILKNGLVADATENNPAASNANQMAYAKDVDRYNKYVKELSDQGKVEVVVLPLFDGLSCLRVVQNE